MELKNKALIITLLIIQTIIYILVGTQKSYIHIDEAYSLGLTHYNKIDLQNNEDFFDKWHTNQYFEEYLSVPKDKIFELYPVYENQKNDVHPPLYYLLLKIAMNFTSGHFTKWSGIILNIIIYIFVTIFMYLILKEILKSEKNAQTKAIILAFMSSIILASISNAVYIRMYALATLNILITLFLHIKLLQSKKNNLKLLIAIGISVLAGSLTHYYYYFYILALYLIIVLKYIREKNRKSLILYTITMIITGILSICIFKHSITHMFFGYRGQGVISKLYNIKEMLKGLFAQIYNLNYYGFNNLLPVIVIITIGLKIYIKIQKNRNPKIIQENGQIINIIIIPAIFFFIMASIASPWNVLRYIVPVCGIIFVIAIYYLYKLVQTLTNEKTSNIVISIFFGLLLISPFILNMEPELLYKDKKEVVAKINENSNLPAIYLYNPKKSNFLDDIELFTILNESYITKDIDKTVHNIKEVIKDKDVSNGIILFISEQQNNIQIIEQIQEELNLKKCTQIQKMNSCEIYYIK